MHFYRLPKKLQEVFTDVCLSTEGVGARVPLVPGSFLVPGPVAFLGEVGYLWSFVLSRGVGIWEWVGVREGGIRGGVRYTLKVGYTQRGRL